MKKLFLLFCASGVITLTGCQPRENRPSDGAISTAAQRIDSLFRNHFEQDLFHGGVVIAYHGETIYENYLGLADRSWGIPFDREVKLDIASVNKSMIAALALKAVEEGRLKLDDQLVELLSGFTYQGHFNPDITLHHLLSHSAGLADYDGISEALRQENYLKFKRSRFTDEAYVDFISQLAPVAEPGKQFHYSNFAYHLVAIILADTYSKPFAEVLEEKLTVPLGLKNTVSEGLNERVIPKLAQAYTYQVSTGQWLENPFLDLSLSRRIFSTAADLNRWAQVMNNPGWLSENSLKLIQKNHLAGISEDFTYGYGWVIIDKENKSAMGDLGIARPYIIHGGRTDGYKSMLINVNQGAYVISFLSNVGNQTDEMQLAQKIVNLLIK
ncbi:serine hydrolase domain-containing protein [Phaeodactylibacter sp.]|uniref:serine hydrolase domain-containing protein n=1 Tax=Phaeodactylibacter sp. TaxID=1940289 RepID=UPI0025DA3B89|nr:serine hydrolase domain-containing protein [Phaeodactylibacter sp.]MCI4650199.1 beta-lactamase family protein [Phaeodactylibacter sp.]MCI5089726.1 beta-lactamase family protein [Phaeodactylibacter sp.]